MAAKAIHSADVLFDVVDSAAAALWEGLLPAQPTLGALKNSIARLEQSGRYENVVRHLRHVHDASPEVRSALTDEMADLAEAAAMEFRSVVDETRGMKPRARKDALRNAAQQVFTSRLAAFDCLAVAAGGRSGDLRRDFARVATAALERVRDQ